MILSLRPLQLSEFLLNQIQILQSIYSDFIQGYAREHLNKILTILRFFTDLLMPQELEDEEVKLSKEERERTEKRQRGLQDVFASLGTVRISLDMVCAYTEFDFEGNYGCKKLYGSLMMFFIGLLLGGNEKIQDQFYEYFSEQPESEKFFGIVKQQLQDEIWKRANVGGLEEARIDDCLNRLEFAYRPRDKFFGTKHLLHFLQLLCEGHHSNLQNYLRKQPNTARNHNMLEIIVHYLDRHIRSQDGKQEGEPWVF